jgi:hypothetical protein
MTQRLLLIQQVNEILCLKFKVSDLVSLILATTTRATTTTTTGSVTTTAASTTTVASTIASSTFAPEILALDALIQMKESIQKFLPSYQGLDDKLEVLIEASLTSLNLPVTPASE